MTVRILVGDVRTKLAELVNQSIDCVVTSPPYFGLRDYGTARWEGGIEDCDHLLDATTCTLCGAHCIDHQIGLEATPNEYVTTMVDVFRDVWRVLKDNGTLWLNIGDSYANDTKWGGSGSGPTSKNYTSGLGGCIGQKAKRNTGLKPKDLMMIPARVAIALQNDGWYLRQDIIWHKLNPLPEPTKDRCTKSHEYIFLLSKSPSYYFDYAAIKEPVVGKSNGMRHRRSVWSIATQSFKDAHFATFPPDLIAPCITAGCPQGGIVLDPFAGAVRQEWLPIG
jgi:DNA modification methylase